jgi:hypothetical protein
VSPGFILPFCRYRPVQADAGLPAWSSLPTELELNCHWGIALFSALCLIFCAIRDHHKQDGEDESGQEASQMAKVADAGHPARVDVADDVRDEQGHKESGADEQQGGLEREIGTVVPGLVADGKVNPEFFDKVDNAEAEEAGDRTRGPKEGNVGHKELSDGHREARDEEDGERDQDARDAGVVDGGQDGKGGQAGQVVPEMRCVCMQENVREKSEMKKYAFRKYS